MMTVIVFLSTGVVVVCPLPPALPSFGHTHTPDSLVILKLLGKEPPAIIPKSKRTLLFNVRCDF